MKKTVFLYYLLFGIVFLIVYRVHNQKYDTPQIATSIDFSKEDLRNVSCTTAGRTWVYKFERPDKSTYYLCSSEIHLHDEEHIANDYMEEKDAILISLLFGSLIAIVLNGIIYQISKTKLFR